MLLLALTSYVCCNPCLGSTIAKRSSYRRNSTFCPASRPAHRQHRHHLHPRRPHRLALSVSSHSRFVRWSPVHRMAAVSFRAQRRPAAPTIQRELCTREINPTRPSHNSLITHPPGFAIGRIAGILTAEVYRAGDGRIGRAQAPPLMGWTQLPSSPPARSRAPTVRLSVTRRRHRRRRRRYCQHHRRCRQHHLHHTAQHHRLRHRCLLSLRQSRWRLLMLLRQPAHGL